jgi:hypothetical protein
MSMAVPSGSSRAHTVVQALCVIVLATIAIAAAYAVWIWIRNYPRIGV